MTKVTDLIIDEVTHQLFVIHICYPGGEEEATLSKAITDAMEDWKNQAINIEEDKPLRSKSNKDFEELVRQ